MSNRFILDDNELSEVSGGNDSFYSHAECTCGFSTDVCGRNGFKMDICPICHKKLNFDRIAGMSGLNNNIDK